MKTFKNIMFYVFLFVISFIIVGSTYIGITQPTSDIPQFLFCLNYGLENSDFSPVIDALKYCIPAFIIIYGIFIYLLKNKSNNIILSYIRNNVKKTYSIITVLTLLIVAINFHAFSFFYYEIAKSNFIEDNYVNPKDVNITFNKKKNLIFIIVESFESTLLSKDKGGKWEYSLIPEIESINEMDDTITFKNKSNLIGMNMISGSIYTTASVFTNHAALPFKYSPTKRLTENDFMKGAYTLGDVLYTNGYHNELISSATTSFGGIKEYFTNHGKYDIIDVDSYQKYGLTANDSNNGPWGFNDSFLYEAAKKRLEVLNTEDKPFNMTLISIDTHFPTGFNGDYSVDKYKSSMANSYATESKLIGEFIDWVKEQDFYHDTTIVIIGDHLSMANNFYRNKDERYIYASYINSDVKTDNLDNRVYTALDTYPTILASLGADIEGNRLGLGTNMFSNELTLSEKYGFNKVNKEVSKKSIFYNKEIMVK